MDPELLDLSAIRRSPSGPSGRRVPARALLAALAWAGLAAAGTGCGSSHPPPPVVELPPPAPPPPPPAAAVPAAPSADSLSPEEARDLAALQAETFKGPIGSTNADLDDELERFLKEESDALLTEKVDYDIPIVINDRVEYFIDYFQHRVDKSFAKWLARAPQVVPYMRARFQQAGLPEDLIYLSLIESGFSPLAASHASAVGYWQFIAGTARRYGLKVDRWVDERRDLERSTEAAIAYLKDLHQMFGSWYLAAAAYNSGEAKIQKAIEKYGSENLWELAEFSYLRSETKDYVPKLIAATLIAKEPERYGFAEVQPLAPMPVDSVTVPTQTDLRVIAAAAGTSVETIRALNPGLRSHATPPDVRDFAVRVPQGSGAVFAQRLARVPPSLRFVERTHVVRRGETPSRIAAEYGIPTVELMAENGIRNPRALRVGQRLRIPRADTEEEPEIAPRLADLAMDGEPAGPRDSMAETARAPQAPAAEAALAAEPVSADSAPSPQELAAAAPAASAGLDAPPVEAAAQPPQAVAHEPPAELPSQVDVAQGPMAQESSPADGAQEPPDQVSSQVDVAQEPAIQAVTGSGAGVPQDSATYAAAPTRTELVPEPSPAGASEEASPAAAEPPLAALPAEQAATGDELLPAVRTARETSRELPGPRVQVSPNVVRHRVRPSDTLHRIALDYGVTVAELRLWNPTLGRRIRPGQTVVVNLSEGRDDSVSAGKEERNDSAADETGPAALEREPMVLRVETGDTLWSIARRHGVTLEQVRRWNGLSGSSIHAGDRLVLFPGEGGR
jgi:membrane-bound lytic murein transglycosylase D